MADFLTKHKAEVMSVCLTEFDEKVFVKGIREEGFEEGIIQGKAGGFREGILELLEDYGALPEALRELIMTQTDVDVLKRWNKIAARAKSIEDFEEKAGLTVKY